METWKEAKEHNHRGCMHTESKDRETHGGKDGHAKSGEKRQKAESPGRPRSTSKHLEEASNERDSEDPRWATVQQRKEWLNEERDRGRDAKNNIILCQKLTTLSHCSYTILKTKIYYTINYSAKYKNKNKNGKIVQNTILDLINILILILNNTDNQVSRGDEENR